MSTNSQDQEIDLSQIGKGISNFFQNRINGFFDFLFFIQKKIKIISILFIVGIALAFLLDGKKNYEHELSLIPNFGSNEYLYKKIDAFDTKIREKDSDFFKEIGINNFKNIKSVKIEALPAIYSFVNARNQGNNFELIKLLSEDGSLEKILTDEMTSKNYYHHKVTIITKGKRNRKDLIEPFLKYLNDSQYFSEQQVINKQNLDEKLVLNDSLIKQIDRLILKLSSNSKSGSSVSITENSSIPALVDKKDNLISESQFLRTNKNIYDKIIKE